MRAKTLQVRWHAKDRGQGQCPLVTPIFSLSFGPGSLLATGGGDNEIKVPESKLRKGLPHPEKSWR